jgi:hypothetical protein
MFRSLGALSGFYFYRRGRAFAVMNGGDATASEPDPCSGRASNECWHRRSENRQFAHHNWHRYRRELLCHQRSFVAMSSTGRTCGRATGLQALCSDGRGLNRIEPDRPVHSVLGAPGGPGAAHVVQLGPIGVEGLGEESTPQYPQAREERRTAGFRRSDRSCFDHSHDAASLFLPCRFLLRGCMRTTSGSKQASASLLAFDTGECFLDL